MPLQEQPLSSGCFPSGISFLVFLLAQTPMNQPVHVRNVNFELQPRRERKKTRR